MNLEKKRVTVVGLGKSGEAAAILLAGKGAIVDIVDDHLQAIPPALAMLQNVTFHRGNQGAAGEQELFFCADQVVVSPGVPLSRLPLSELAQRGIPVIGEMELASRFLTAPIIAITGTNGKSTTSTLVAEILAESSFRVFLGGNIGVPLSCAVGGTFDYIVVEVSSFQLETIDTFRPHIAAVLNVTEDHLNRHGRLEPYGAIKRRIFKNQGPEDYALFNAGDPLTTPSAHAIPVRFYPPEGPFSTSSPAERSVFLQGEQIVSNIAGEVQPVIARDTIKLSGRPNLENVMAAIAMSQLAGASHEAICRILSRFSGLPHRMENAGLKNGVQYINDSKGTNVGAVYKSLEGMAHPVVWIAGGMDKGADFTPLRAMLHKVRCVILMGQAAETMAHCFCDHSQIVRVSSMKEAVLRAAATGQAGEVVLLSPACASFDMFRNFEHRGDCFKQAVAEL